jgi:DNA topoisomerase I
VLLHVSGAEPGLSRAADGLILGVDGEPVAEAETLARVAGLKIPPAWTGVWIAREPDAHLQATGFDSRGRRQYLYHPAWRERRDHLKFDDMLAFARGLPALRETVARRLVPGEPSHEQVLALALRLLDIGFFRVGWDRYARDNGHVGLTTLRREQVQLLGDAVRFDYVAKAGKRRRMTVRDEQAMAVLAPLRRRRSGPEELLAYRAAHGWHRLGAADVNNGLRAWAGGPYSAKEFRTWAGTVLAAVALAREDADSQRGPRAVNRAVKVVSTALGNTPTVARASYIDPRVIDAFDRGTVIALPEGLPPAPVPVRIDDGADGVVVELPADAPRASVEVRVLALLES